MATLSKNQLNQFLKSMKRKGTDAYTHTALPSPPESFGGSYAIPYLNYNELTSLPDSITNLSNLIYLVLSFNQLTHLPNNIGDLSNMIWFDFTINSLADGKLFISPMVSISPSRIWIFFIL